MTTDRDPGFTTTNWSVVVAAASSDPALAAVALERLCARYWYPVYAFVRHRGKGAHEAEDIAQGFFHFIIERQAFRQADPHKGRFRSFLLASLVNFLHNDRDKNRALKRGGGARIASLEEESLESIFTRETVSGDSPRISFERRWASHLVRRVLNELLREHERRGRGAVFRALQPYLAGEPAGEDYARAANELNMAPGAVKVALHRARRRFGELLRREVAHTVAEPGDVEAEIRYLLTVLAE